MINILSKETIDKIAAGEVAERPESVVKELIDNSVDSGADSVSVEIRDGGLSLIRVTDNGSGIEQSDVRTAFLRHATSKLKTADDIEHVLTMGFRGEALASIAAVSNTELITKTKESLTGTRYCIEFGSEKSMNEIGAPDGTTVIIRDFLLNVPVRRQFLKSAQTESSYIVAAVEKQALSHPDIAVSLSVDGRNYFATAGNGRLLDVIYVVFGKEAAISQIPVDNFSSDIHVRGYAGKPSFSRSRRDYEIFIVNGRCVKSDILQKALEDAYSPYLMQHKFPAGVINIDLPPEKVDVNVHPRKTEVRFSDTREIYDAVYESVKNVLADTELIVDAGSAYMLKTEKSQKRVMAYKAEDKQSITVEDAASHSVSFNPQPYEPNRKLEFAVRENAKAISVVQASNAVPRGTQGTFINKSSAPYFRMVGQVFDTYWIIEFDGSMYVIDQHAAHEKVNYEHFVKLIESHSAESQMLYPPVVLTLSAREALLLQNSIDCFNDIGYEIEYAGDRDYIVRAVPSNLPEMGDAELLTELIGELSEESRGLSSASMKDRIATMSCKAAVKGSRPLSEPEMRSLISELLTLDNPYNCPHGRPTIVKFSKNDLDKMFKRIVT